MTAHVFVDETKERGYFMAAVEVRSDDLSAARQKIRSLILPRQRRIHFTGESDTRRRRILDSIIDLGIAAVIYDASSHRSQIRGRAACLNQLVADLAKTNAQRVVLELDDAAVKADRALLYTQVHAAGLAQALRYDHMRAHEECLLAIPDAVAWCWARAGLWRARIRPIVSRIQRV